MLAFTSTPPSLQEPSICTIVYSWSRLKLERKELQSPSRFIRLQSWMTVVILVPTTPMLLLYPHTIVEPPQRSVLHMRLQRRSRVQLRVPRNFRDRDTFKIRPLLGRSTNGSDRSKSRKKIQTQQRRKVIAPTDNKQLGIIITHSCSTTTLLQLSTWPINLPKNKLPNSRRPSPCSTRTVMVSHCIVLLLVFACVFRAWHLCGNMGDAKIFGLGNFGPVPG